MINRSIYTCIILLSLHLNAMDEKQKPLAITQVPENQIAALQKQLSTAATTYIANGSTTNNYYYTTATAQSNADATAKAKNENNSSMEMKSFMSTLQTTIAPLPEQLQGWARTHKWQITAGSTMVVYTIIFAILAHGNQHLASEVSWGQWKRHLSIDELHTYCLDDQKKQELTHNLIDTILTRYFKTRQPTNHIDPLVDFMNSLEQEMKIMNRYIAIATFVQKLHLMKLFPTNDTKIAQAKEYRQRLYYIKQLFINSMKNYNLNQLLLPKPSLAITVPPLAVSEARSTVPAVAPAA